MINLYGYDTVNTLKVLIMLEEIGADYRVIRVNIHRGEQKFPEFLKINPNGKVPVIIEESAAGESLKMSESGAILLYLAKRFENGLPTPAVEQARAIEWLMYQISTQGPAFGQCEYWYRLAPDPHEEVINHYLGVAQQVLAKMNNHLTRFDFFAGSHFSIADIAFFGWMSKTDLAGVSFDQHTAVVRWFNRIMERPSVTAALQRAADLRQ